MNDYKIGKCKWCGESGEVFCDNALCDDCDSNTIRCRICRRRFHWDNKCRHIFQDENFEWRGAGVSPTDQDMKIPFHLFLSAMGEEFSRDLKAAIKDGKFYTWMIAPMIGGGGTLDLGGMSHKYGDAIIKLGESSREEKVGDGYRWLVSLYKRQTTRANRATLAWIDQWLWPLSRL
jgi:hypothetical protein